MMDFNEKTALHRHLESQLPKTHIVPGRTPDQLILTDRDPRLVESVTREVKRFYEGLGHALEPIAEGFSYRSMRPGIRQMITVKDSDGRTRVDMRSYDNLNK